MAVGVGHVEVGSEDRDRPGAEERSVDGEPTVAAGTGLPVPPMVVMMPSSPIRRIRSFWLSAM